MNTANIRELELDAALWAVGLDRIAVRRADVIQTTNESCQIMECHTTDLTDGLPERNRYVRAAEYVPAIDHAREQVEIGLLRGGVRERLEADIAGRVSGEIERHPYLSPHAHVSG